MKKIILLLAFSLTGCTTAMYQGERPLSEVAKIISEDTFVKKVDGVSVPYSGGNYANILVLPGERKLEVYLNKHTGTQSMTSSKPISVYINAEPGKEYVTSPVFLGNSRWFPVVKDTSTKKLVQYSEKDKEQLEAESE